MLKIKQPTSANATIPQFYLLHLFLSQHFKQSQFLGAQMKIIQGIFTTLILCSILNAHAGEDSVTAISRSNAQNYKDRALASCIATAYKGSSAGEDADITKSVFLEWLSYDDDKGNPATDRLVDQYLRRDYSNPMEGYAGAKFKLLKCLDMYHSQELQNQVKKYVPHPDWIGSKPAKRNSK